MLTGSPETDPIRLIEVFDNEFFHSYFSNPVSPIPIY